jgi:hypothetical protein
MIKPKGSNNGQKWGNGSRNELQNATKMHYRAASNFMRRGEIFWALWKVVYGVNLCLRTCWSGLGDRREYVNVQDGGLG